MFKIGLSRAIEEDDIYAVPNSMRSDRNTEHFAKLWQLELQRKNPSILRVIFNVYGIEVCMTCLLYSVAEILAK